MKPEQRNARAAALGLRQQEGVGPPCVRPPFLPRLKEHQNRVAFVMQQRGQGNRLPHPGIFFWLMSPHTGTHTAKRSHPDALPCGSKSPPPMEASEQALDTVLAPSPSIWKETRSPEDGSAEGTGPPRQARTTSATLAGLGTSPALELLQGRATPPQACEAPGDMGA